jgi:uncharacterized protein (DUF362 family)
VIPHPEPRQRGPQAIRLAESLPFLVPHYDYDRRPFRSRVAILPATEYSEKLSNLLWDGLKLFNLNVAGKSVVLKPNLGDYIPGAEINTHPMLIVATAECFRRLGAKRVIVAEGPGHQRDTHLVLRATGLAHQLKEQRIPFVDLNRDEVTKVRLRADYSPSSICGSRALCSVLTSSCRCPR